MVMLQSVLSATPSYSMTCFKLPLSLCKKIQSVVTRFWWDNNENARKMAWVSWNKLAKPKAIGGLGFRDFEIFNDALLVKIGWRILHNPTSLLARVLLGKYCLDNSFLQVKETTAISHGWRSILAGRDLLLNNLGWVVGDGASINIWNDPWLSLTKQERPMGPPGEQSLYLTVSDLMTACGREWDHRRTSLLLPDYESKILCNKPSITGVSDKLIWLGTKNGEYTTRSGYYSMVDDGSHEAAAAVATEINWNRGVWRLDCAPKVKLFSWKLLKGALPVGERLVERHIPADPLCKLCGNSESIIHLFFQCPYAQKLWSLAPFVEELECRGTIDLATNWVMYCGKQCLPPAGIPSGALFPWIVWALWKARNRFVFEGFSASPEDTLSSAIVLAREWAEGNKEETPHKRKQPQAEVFSPRNSIVVRSDAAWAEQ